MKSDNGVACWGANNDGQLGDGTNTDSFKPVDVLGISDAVGVAAGSAFTCALRAIGTVSCWGHGEHTGALGDGNDTSSNTPVAVSGLTDAVAVAAGAQTACALTAGGSISCWGWHFAPPTNGMPGVAKTPVQLQGVSAAQDLSVGDGEVCAIGRTSTDCWGYWKQLDSGSTTASPMPIALPASSAIQQSTGGVFGGCALLASGQVSCHGRNSRGQLGNGTVGGVSATDGIARGQSLALGISDARAVASSESFGCALLFWGGVRCWGAIGNGLGSSSEASDVVATPAAIPGILYGIDIAAGFGHVCVVDSDGLVECWGSNFVGQLGNGSTASAVCPRFVPGLVATSSAQTSLRPVRRDEADVKVQSPVQAVGTTPPPPSPETLSCVTTPRQPAATTPTTATAAVLKPAVGPSIAATIKPAAALAVEGGVVRLVSFRVPQRWVGKCPKTTKVTVQAAGRTTSKTLRVKRTEAGTCEVTGLVALRGRLAKAKRVRIIFRPQGVPAFKRTVATS